MTSRHFASIIILQVLLAGCAPSERPSVSSTPSPPSFEAPPVPPPPPSPSAPPSTSATTAATSNQISTERQNEPTKRPSPSAAAFTLPAELAEFAKAETLPEIRVVTKLSGPKQPVMLVDISGDKSCAVTVHQNAACRAWNAQTGELLSTLPPQASKLNCLTVSHDGKYALVGYESGGAVVWENCDGQHCVSSYGNAKGRKACRHLPR
jgi:WD40 repeat protein